MLAHVITKEPDFDRLPDALPAQVEDLVRRCLRKDVAMRIGVSPMTVTRRIQKGLKEMGVTLSASSEGPKLAAERANSATA